MTEQQTTDAPIGPVDTARRRRFRLRRPGWTVIGGIVAGASFTGGYLFNSFFYCQAQFSCSLSPFWLAGIALIGAGIGAIVGWAIGKFMRFFYGVTRVD